MKKIFILIALTFSASTFASEVTPEKIEACRTARFNNADFINECLNNNASVEKINACAAIGYTDDSYLTQCFTFTRATPDKIQACSDVGFLDQENLNECLSTNAELFKISACGSLGLREKDIILCMKRI